MRGRPAELMVVLDLTIMNIAVPSAQRALHFTTVDRQWVVTAYLTAARVTGRQALTGPALAHGYDTAFWWTAGIFAAGAVIAGALLRPGPLAQQRTPSPAGGGVPTAQAETDPVRTM